MGSRASGALRSAPDFLKAACIVTSGDHRRDRYPESAFWETEAGRNWLIRLVVATLFVFGLKRGVGAETLSEFFGRLHLEAQVGCSSSALRRVMHTLERIILDSAAPGNRRALPMARYARSSGLWMKPSCSV